jgi:hypothetical protein
VAGRPAARVSWRGGESGALVFGLGDELAGLVLDLDRDLGECLGVLAVVMRAEQQFARTRQEYAYIRWRSASIAQVMGG